MPVQSSDIMSRAVPSLPDTGQIQAQWTRLLGEVRSLPQGGELLDALEPERVEADYERAWTMLSTGDLVAATDAFGELARRVPDQHRIQFGFALCLQHHGLLVDALKHYGLAFVLDPSSAACAFRIGECLWAQGDHEDAREAMLTAIELSRIAGNDQQIRLLAQSALDDWVSGAA